MNEKKSDLSKEYIIEAKKLLENHMQKMKEYLNKVKMQGNKGRDFSSNEEKKLNSEFNQSLKELKIKYNIL